MHFELASPAPTQVGSTLGFDIESAVDCVIRARDVIAAHDQGFAFRPLSDQGHHRLTLSILGTISDNVWISGMATEVACRLLPGRISPDRNVIAARFFKEFEDADWVQDFLESEDFPRASQGYWDTEGASASGIALKLRDLSGLRTEDLATLFPVSRESYQRWASGTVTPSVQNMRQLLAIEALVEEASSRVADTRTWLLASADPTAEGESPFEMLRAGQLSRVWRLLNVLPSRRQYEAVRMVDGDWAYRVTGSVHSDNAATPSWEVDEGVD